MRYIGWITIELSRYGSGLVTLTVELWKENCHSEIFLVETTAEAYGKEANALESKVRRAQELRAVLAAPIRFRWGSATRGHRRCPML